MRKKTSFVSIAKILLVLLLSGCVTMLAYAASADGDFKVTVVRQAGKVEAKLAGKKDWVKSEPDMQLVSGDSLRTQKSAKVQLLFPGDAIVLIKENSQLNLKDFPAGGGARVNAVAGSFLFNLQKALSPGSTFDVETEGALAVVRGTKWAEFIGLDGSLWLVAFINDVEVTAGGVTVVVAPGYETRVSPGGSPSAPVQSSYTEEDADGDFTFASDDEQAQLTSALSSYLADLSRLQDEVTKDYSDFMDFYSENNVPGMTLIYRNVQEYRSRLKTIAEKIVGMANSVAPGANGGPKSDYYVTDSGIIAVASEPPSGWEGTIGSPSGPKPTFGGLLKDARGRTKLISDMLDEMDLLILQFMSNPPVELDKLSGLIPNDDPSLSIREASIDSDNDGLPDPLELELGLDPNVSDAIDGYIKLLDPVNEQTFTWPSDSAIDFGFVPIDSQYIGNYRLFVESGGVIYSQPLLSDTVSLSVDTMLDKGGGNFGQLFADTSSADFTWYVTAEINSPFFNPTADSGVSQITGSTITSNKRTFTLVLAKGGSALVRVEPQTTTVKTDDTLTVGLFVQVDGPLKSVMIRLRFDPSVLEFDQGRTGLFFQNSTLFFSDSVPGEVLISGQVDRDTGFVTGEGTLCEMDFHVRGQPSSVTPLDIIEAGLLTTDSVEFSVIREDAQIEVVQ